MNTAIREITGPGGVWIATRIIRVKPKVVSPGHMPIGLTCVRFQDCNEAAHVAHRIPKVTDRLAAENNLPRPSIVSNRRRVHTVEPSGMKHPVCCAPGNVKRGGPTLQRFGR